MDHRFADPHAVNVEPKATSSGENLQNVGSEILFFFLVDQLAFPKIQGEVFFPY